MPEVTAREFEEHLKKCSNLGSVETYDYSHYYKDVSHLKVIDFYRICELYEITDSCDQHALKKILAVGKRGHKDVIEDTHNIIDTMKRKLKMIEENIK